MPASGIGSRMGADCPKQYLPFDKNTVIETTLNTLLDFERIEGAIIVLNQDDQYWSQLNFTHKKPVYTTIGSSERSGSVFNGLQKLSEITQTDQVVVMIHDAVRPCITHDDLSKLVKNCDNGEDAVFLAHPVTDTIKTADAKGYSLTTVDRRNLWRAFTPQVFTFNLIEKALKFVVKHQLEITDDVSAVEQIGIQTKMLLGRSDNIKITYPQDILVAQTILKNQIIKH